MSDRERWIVYPLIFLALGVALRDKITRTIDDVELIGGESVQVDFKRGVAAGQGTRAQIDFVNGVIEADTIRCKRMVVEHDLNAAQTATQRIVASEVLVLGPDRKACVLIGLHSDDSRQPAPAEKGGGQIVVFGPDGKAQVLLTRGVAGGEVAVVDKTLRLRLNFGGFSQGVMLGAETGSGEKIPFLTLPPGLDPTKAPPVTKPESTTEKAPAKTNLDDSSPGPPEPEEE